MAGDSGGYVDPNSWNAIIPTNPELHHTHMIYFILGCFICIFGLVSLGVKEKLYMSEAMVSIRLTCPLNHDNYGEPSS
jgi:hypothetical protein